MLQSLTLVLNVGLDALGVDLDGVLSESHVVTTKKSRDYNLIACLPLV